YHGAMACAILLTITLYREASRKEPLMPDVRFWRSVRSLVLALAAIAVPAIAQPCEWATGFHFPGVNSAVSTLTLYDDGNGPALYAGGTFTGAGEVAVNKIAKWDGVQWSGLGGGTNNTVYALAVYDDGSGLALYAGGMFLSAGGMAANRIAKWDG